MSGFPKNLLLFLVMVKKKPGKALKDLRIEYYEANEYDLTHLTLERIQVFQKEIHFGSIMWLFPLRDGFFSIIGQLEAASNLKLEK